MAKALRVDSVLIGLDGTVNVSYTSGETPLPSASGQGFSFASRQALTTALQDYEGSISAEQLVFLALSTWIKADPQLANPLLATNKTAQLDLLGAQTAIKLS